MSQQPRIALAGHSGFIGRALTAAAGDLDIRFRNVQLRVKRSSDEPVPAAEAAGDWIQANPEQAERVLEDLAHVDVVINAAGLALPESNDWNRLLEANAVLPGVLAHLAAKAGVRRLVQVSSAAVQGKREPLDETLDVAPITPYGRSKALGERVLVDGSLSVPAEVVIYRPTSVQAADRGITRRLVSFASRRVLPVGGDGQPPLPLCLVENVAAGILCAAASEERPKVVLQPWEGVTTRLLWDLFGRGPKIVPIPRPPLKAALLAGSVVGRGVPKVAAAVRRLDLLLLGQAQEAEALGQMGFDPPRGIDSYRELAERVRSSR